MATPIPQPIRSALEILRVQRRMAGGPPEPDEGVEGRIAKVIAAFDGAGASWALIGAHAVNVLVAEPRATVDFDFVVDERRLARILQALEQEFGDLDAEDIGAAVRLRAISVDLVRSNAHSLFRAALDEAQVSGGWRVPDAALLMALKFLAAVSPWRGRERRVRDIADLMALYRSAEAGGLDRSRMLVLAAQVYPGAEREFADLIARIDRGEPISI